MYGPVKVPVSNRMIDGHIIGELGVLQHLRQVDAHLHTMCSGGSTFAHRVLRWRHICTPCAQVEAHLHMDTAMCSALTVQSWCNRWRRHKCGLQNGQPCERFRQEHPLQYKRSLLLIMKGLHVRSVSVNLLVREADNTLGGLKGAAAISSHQIPDHLRQENLDQCEK